MNEDNVPQRTPADDRRRTTLTLLTVALSLLMSNTVSPTSGLSMTIVYAILSGILAFLIIGPLQRLTRD